MKRFALGIGIGLAAGILLNSRVKKEVISPESALKAAKNNLSKTFNVTGSWIHMIPETLKKNELEYTIYRGGISTSEENETLQYDFVIDAKTGTVLELTK